MASVVGVDPWGALRRLATRVKRKPRPPDSVSESMVAEITLRLLDQQPAAPLLNPPPIRAEDIESFAITALTGDTADVLLSIDRHLHRGLSLETIFVHLLAPAARRLGEGWESDQLDFLDVTMGLWRLQEALREVSARSPAVNRSLLHGRFALFAPVPGDQHGFGTTIVEECFARAGWGTELLIGPSRTDLLGAVADNFCDLLGLTVSTDCPIDKIHSLIVAVRSVSQNPDIVILLGGRVLIEDPGVAAAAGADGTAPTAIDAVRLAEGLLEARHVAAAR